MEDCEVGISEGDGICGDIWAFYFWMYPIDDLIRWYGNLGTIFKDRERYKVEVQDEIRKMAGAKRGYFLNECEQ